MPPDMSRGTKWLPNPFHTIPVYLAYPLPLILLPRSLSRLAYLPMVVCPPPCIPSSLEALVPILCLSSFIPPVHPAPDPQPL